MPRSFHASRLITPPALAPIALALLARPVFGGCAADVTGDGAVDVSDLLEVLEAWGPCPGCAADIDGDGEVAISDLLAVLGEWGQPCGGDEVIAADIAGQPLPAFPHFAFERTSNAGAEVFAGVDGHVHPAVVGATADVYVVEARSDAGWASDPSLTDVRGGPTTHAFGGPDIQDMTVSLGAAIPGDDGLAVGTGYDIVVDLNRNGALDAGDLIDGLGPEAGMYVASDLSAAGPLAVSEIPPYSVGTVFGIVSTRTFEEAFHPTDIASMGALPLVVVSHGNGHDYQWYDHIGHHMASHGYVVMSHQNNTGPGIDTAAVTTLGHTDAFLDQLDTIGGGVLEGHVDASRILWLGHSRGGEGVVRAYDRIVGGSWTPTSYALEDIIVVSSICPTYFSPGTSIANPHDVNYHLFYTGADSDVSGSPSSTSSKPFAIYERGTGTKHLTYLHGAGHGDFHNGGGNPWATGPDLIGTARTHDVLLGYLLAIGGRYAQESVPALDYLERPYGAVRPAGIEPQVIVAKEFRDALAADLFFIDDYQSSFSTGTSSSGGPVTFDVSNVVEGDLEDLDGSFNFSSGVPFNGMTRQRFSFDTERSVVFDWQPGSDRFYELGIVPGERNLSSARVLSFRACQGTRHPETDALDAPLDFTVTLRDGAGATSSINFAAYAAEITRTYKRTGAGTGAGWANEFVTVRIPLADFRRNGSALDLSDVEAVRFEFGGSYGSARGRIGLDDVHVVR